MNFYHYTTEWKARLILDSGKLIPTGKPASPREKPVLWFSTNTEYEATAIKPIIMNKQVFELPFEEYREVFTLYRFRLESDRYLSPWRTTVKNAKTPSKLRKAMELRGKEQGGKPSQWFGTLDEVPTTELSLEILTLNRWIVWNEDIHGMPAYQPEEFTSAQYNDAMKELRG